MQVFVVSRTNGLLRGVALLRPLHRGSTARYFASLPDKDVKKPGGVHGQAAKATPAPSGTAPPSPLKPVATISTNKAFVDSLRGGPSDGRRIQGVHVIYNKEQPEWMKSLAIRNAALMFVSIGAAGYCMDDGMIEPITAAVIALGAVVAGLATPTFIWSCVSRLVLDTRYSRVSIRGHKVSGSYGAAHLVNLSDIHSVREGKRFTSFYVRGPSLKLSTYLPWYIPRRAYTLQDKKVFTGAQSEQAQLQGSEGNLILSSDFPSDPTSLGTAGPGSFLKAPRRPEELRARSASSSSAAGGGQHFVGSKLAYPAPAAPQRPLEEPPKSFFQKLFGSSRPADATPAHAHSTVGAKLGTGGSASQTPAQMFANAAKGASKTLADIDFFAPQSCVTLDKEGLPVNIKEEARVVELLRLGELLQSNRPRS